MMIAGAFMGLAAAASCVVLCAQVVKGQSDASISAASTVSAEYFEGRWAFIEESCDVPTNWTLIGGGNFVSEDLTGTWAWDGEMMTLSLIDLAVDEETGEAGGRFQMQGPIKAKGADAFAMTIEPEVYELKRCRG